MADRKLNKLSPNEIKLFEVDFSQQSICEGSLKRKSYSRRQKNKAGAPRRSALKSASYLHNETTNEELESIDCFSSSDDDDCNLPSLSSPIGTVTSSSQISAATSCSSQIEQTLHSQDTLISDHSDDDMVVSKWQHLSDFNDHDDILSDVSDRSPGVTQTRGSNDKPTDSSLPLPFPHGHDQLTSSDTLVSSKSHSKAIHSSDEEWKPDLVDSSKKGKQSRRARSGYVNQLRRIVSREKADLSFWLHSRQKAQPGGDDLCSESGTLSLTVNRIDNVASSSLAICHCQLTSCGVVGKERRFSVILQRRQCSQSLLTVGCQFKLYPPWEMVELDLVPVPVILCAHFLKIEACASSDRVTDKEADEEPAESLMDEILPSAKITTEQVQDRLQESVTISAAMEQCQLMGRVSFNATVKRILTENNAKFYCFGSDPPQDRFSKGLLPLLSNSQTNCHGDSKALFFGFVQDAEGMIARIEFANAPTVNKWHRVICNEGQGFHFKDIRVKKRLSRTRDANLFTVIDHLRAIRRLTESHVATHPLVSQQPMASTQLIQEWGEDRASLNAQTQACCYYFEIDELSSFEDICLQCVSSQPRSAPADARPRSKRCTFYCYCICMSSRKEPSSSQDASNYMHVYPITTASCDQTEDVLNAKHLSKLQPFLKMTRRVTFQATDFAMSKLENGGNVMRFRDVLISAWPSQNHAGDFALDKYSKVTWCCPDGEHMPNDDALFQVENVSIYTELMRRHPVPPILQLPKLEDDNVAVGALVSVTGCVCGVNEEKASQWMACTECGSSQFNPTDASFCLHCDQVVDTRMQIELEVFVHIPSLQNCIVAIELLQASAVALLPSLASSQIEGLDVNCILQKQVNQLPCTVLSNSMKRTQRGLVRFLALSNVNLLLEQASL